MRKILGKKKELLKKIDEKRSKISSALACLHAKDEAINTIIGYIHGAEWIAA